MVIEGRCHPTSGFRLAIVLLVYNKLQLHALGGTGGTANGSFVDEKTGCRYQPRPKCETHLKQQGTISSSLQLVGGHNQELEMGYELSY